MNRRGFLKRLGLVVGMTAAAPAVFLPTLEKVTWKRAHPGFAFAGYDLGVLNAEMVLMRNLEFLKNRLARLDFLKDPDTGLWLTRYKFSDGSQQFEVARGVITGREVRLFRTL